MAANHHDDPMHDLSKASKDVAYAGIGLAVLAFQKFQVQRRSLERALAEASAARRQRPSGSTRRGTDHR
jgi:hypothetical protein